MNYSGGIVNITAPAAGTVFVTANVNMLLYHTTGTFEEMQMGIGSTSTDCGTYQDDITWETPAAYPTFAGQMFTFTVQRAFSVGSAGTYTYYLNGWKINGNVAAPQDSFNYASMHAMYFHP